jgi:alpha-beta hydrolase superfamily lysophospholipase
VLGALVKVGVATVVVGAVAIAGAGWYYADVLTTVERDRVYDLPVLGVDDGPAGQQVTVPHEVRTAQPGRYGLVWPAGWADVGPLLDVTGTPGDGTVDYRVRSSTAPLRAGTDAAWSAFVFFGDPSIRGVPFREVRFPSDPGDMPAWQVPGEGDTWVIAVHGRGATREEALRVLPALRLPTMVIGYRNDADAPASPTGRYRLGDDEWRDVEAAMRWAQRRGAERFVLYGWSMGGAIVLQTLDRAALADRVVGVVLDSPVVSWTATLEQQARLILPSALESVAGPFAWSVGQMTQARFGLDLARFDWVARADELSTPMLVFHGPQDTFVPAEPSAALAAARPDLVTYVAVDDAEHTAMWNVDRPRYEAALRTFLAEATRG